MKLVISKGFESASLAYLSGLEKCKEDVIVFAHQDVYIPAGWEKHLERAINQLENEKIPWAVLGVFGVDMSNKFYGQVWSSGLNRELMFPLSCDSPQPIVSIDELVIVLNRKAGVLFDADLPGFHLYGTDIVQTALGENKGAYVFNGPVVHNSNPVYGLDKGYRQAYRYMAHKWKHLLPLITCIVPVTTLGFSLVVVRLNLLKKRYLHRKKLGGRLDDPVLIADKLNYQK